jgi:hypothetical protein
VGNERQRVLGLGAWKVDPAKRRHSPSPLGLLALHDPECLLRTQEAGRDIEFHDAQEVGTSSNGVLELLMPAF